MGFPVLWLVLGCCAYGCLVLVGLGSSDLDFRVFRDGRGDWWWLDLVVVGASTLGVALLF